MLEVKKDLKGLVDEPRKNLKKGNIQGQKIFHI